MYLKSLVLKGFKSFADRTELALQPGITAIVGPNGSGKSNISDAVLWVLGERNVKHLRGQSMEDVIFAGSSARKAAGLAEVDLVLDNTDATLPVDFDEVVITRRMYRSGESEYLINGVLVRRLDVLDILHDSGLGTGTHSIISQGALDSILQSKPEDRRALIEEAAGVLKHKQRKEKSERKLAAMDQHVARVRDVVGEVSRQLAPLQRKAKRALTYQGLADDLAEESLKLAVDDLRHLQRSWDASVATERELSAAVEEKRAAIDEAEQSVEELQERIRLEGVDADEMSRLRQRMAAALERFDSTLLIIRDRERSALTRATEIQLSLDEVQTKRANEEAALQNANSSLATAHNAREEADAHVAELSEKYRELDARCTDLEKESAELEQNIHTCEAQIDQARLERTQVQEALTNGLAHLKVIEGHRSELELQLSGAQADATSAAAEVDAAADAAAALDEQETAARKLVGSCSQAREAARAALDEARDAEHSLTARIQALEEVDRTSVAAAGPARAWLTEHGDELAGALEPLAHVLRASAEREALVEALLGPDVSMLLIDDATCAAALADALTEADQVGEVSLILRDDDTSQGKTAGRNFLPKTSAYPKDAPGTPLIDDLEYPDSSARVVSALLGDVIVCDTLDEALRAHADDTLGLRFVAEDGSVVWATGKVTIGRAVLEDDEGALARTRHIEELRQSLLEAQEATKRAYEQASDAEESLREAQKSSLDLSQKLATIRGDVASARTQATRAEEKLDALRRELESVEQQRSEAVSTVNEARPDIETFEKRISEQTERLEKAKARQGEIADALIPIREDLKCSSDELSEAKLQSAKLAERDTYLTQVRDTHLSDLEETARQAEESRSLLIAKRVSAQRLEALLPVFESLTSSANANLADLDERASVAQDSSTGLHQQASEARTRAREAHNAYDEVNGKLSEARVEKGRLELQVETAVNVIEKDCKTTLEQALTLPELEDRQTCEEEVAHLRRRIANLGTINPDAANEYDELKERYDYLASQLADLEAARKSLAKINRVIDERMRQDFIRTFEEVDNSFREIFATLFPGGTANLCLVDPDDLENTGVEVNAQPAGKRIAKMSLMSGGEKSLTALALLFAVYRTRSTPFYILDEVEAALDDINLRRLMSYIDQLRNTTQLIMITHQRRTMEMADVLFGVSMQADGVTKVISQKLSGALAEAD